MGYNMAGKRRRRRRRRAGNWFSRLSIGKKIALCMGSLVLCLAASGVIFVAAKLGKLDTEEIDAADIQVNKEAEETGEGYTNVALFGIDSRSGELEKGTRTDCIIVASLNNKTKEVRMSSVYRDTLLDIKDGQTVKGTNFVNLRQAGDPVELGRAYSEQGADELVFLDITASHEGRKTFTELVKRIAANINIPFTVGGGVRTGRGPLARGSRESRASGS